MSVTLRGLNLTGATLSTNSGQITLQSATFVDDETMTVDVVIPGGTATDTEHTITATSGMESADISFRVIPAGTPFIGEVSPPFGNRGGTLAVLLDGINLATVTTGTGVNLSGPKINESNAESPDDQTVRAILDLSVTASTGFRDVTVITAAGSFTRSAAFRVNIPGQLPIIADVAPSVVDPDTTTTITVTGSGFDGAGVTVGGPGATVTNLAVDETETTITFDLTITADAPAESRPLIVVTENGTATCRILSRPAPIEFNAARFVKTGAAFEVPTAGYRLFLFEFSLNVLFEEGARSRTFASKESRFGLTRLDAESIRRAVRDLPFGYVRVRAVTATSQLGSSDPVRFRR